MQWCRLEPGTQSSICVPSVQDAIKILISSSFGVLLRNAYIFSEMLVLVRKKGQPSAAWDLEESSVRDSI